MKEDFEPLLIISSIPVFTESLVWAAGLGGRPCWVMSDERTPTWCALPHVRGFERIDREELVAASESLLGRIADVCETHSIQTVVAGDTRGTRLLHRLGMRLPPGVRHFPMCEPEMFEHLYHKGRFATLLEDLALPGPQTVEVRSVEDFANVEIEPPVIIKPIQSEGGDGIHRADTATDARMIVAQSESPCVVQSFIPGTDVDVSILADHGECVAWTVQQLLAPGRMRFQRDEEALVLGRRLVEKIGYHGVIHLDMRIDERTGEVSFIEANPRFWGSLAYSVWAGVNFLDLGLRMMDGEDVSALFGEVEGICPYLAATRSSFVRDLLGGWPPPRGLSGPQRRAWKFHHGCGSGAIRGSLGAWFSERDS